MHRLHSEIEPAFFSTNFRPMGHLVRVLSAEAKQRQKFAKDGKINQDDDDKSDVSEVLAEEELASVVRVLTLEGRVIKARGLNVMNTVADLRKVIAQETGASLLEMRLYIDLGTSQNRALGDLAAASSLELLHDGTRTLQDVGLLTAPEWRAVHLRNREYEALRTQLAVATEVIERILEHHYDDFAANFHNVEDLANEFDQFYNSVTQARACVIKARDALGLPRGGSRTPSNYRQEDTDDDDDSIATFHQNDNDNFFFEQEQQHALHNTVHHDPSQCSLENNDPHGGTDHQQQSTCTHPTIRITGAWEDKIEAEEALRLLSLLRQKFPGGANSS
uniref:Ubiquitin-like domain-containing protein n=1 Tax=Aureoumbra lagunensis TaxID=44058 RepID=A0A7S3JS14_9STRA